MTTTGTPKAKGMCIATRCTSVDQFIEMFHRFVDEDSFFVSTVNTRPPGLETSFSVQLADGTPVLRGLCVVLQAWKNSSSPFKTPGVRLGIQRLTANSMPVFERLLVTRSAPPQPVAALAAGTPAPRRQTPTTPIDNAQFAESVPTTVSMAAKLPTAPRDAEQRTPGSDLVLPANPLMNLSDASLDGFVDCTLYEETGNFFPVDDDGSPLEELLPPPSPPLLAPRPVAAQSPFEIAADEPGSMSASSSDVSVLVPLPVPPPGVLVSSTVSTPPAIPATPPPMPRRPTPLPGVALAVAPEPAVPVMRESTPSGEIMAVQPETRRGKGARIAIAVAGLAVVAGTIYWVTSRSDGSTQAAAAPGPMPAAKTQATAQPEPPAPVAEPPPPAPTPAAPDTGSDDEAAVDEPEGAAPMAGEGPCKMVVQSTPAGSMVFLDGKQIAPSPITIATTCAAHKLDFAHPRYQSATKQVAALKEGAPGQVSITLQRPTHQVKITSQPSGATVFIDGLRAGTTPTVLSVMGFSNLKVELKKTGYAPLSQKLYSKVANDNLNVKLTKW